MVTVSKLAWSIYKRDHTVCICCVLKEMRSFLGELERMVDSAPCPVIRGAVLAACVYLVLRLFSGPFTSCQMSRVDTGTPWWWQVNIPANTRCSTNVGFEVGQHKTSIGSTSRTMSMAKECNIVSHRMNIFKNVYSNRARFF